MLSISASVCVVSWFVSLVGLFLQPSIQLCGSINTEEKSDILQKTINAATNICSEIAIAIRFPKIPIRF
jgi:hypothetical protein